MQLGAKVCQSWLNVLGHSVETNARSKGGRYPREMSSVPRA